MKILHFLQGYAIITVRGADLLRFLRDCTDAGVRFSHLRKKSRVCLCASIPARDVGRAERIASASGALMAVSREGAAAVIKRRGNAVISLVCALICAAALIAASKLVLRIAISGNEAVSAEEISDTLEQMGIRRFVTRSSVDCDSAERRLLLAYPQFAYVDVGITGTELFVKVEEGISPPEIPDTSRPADIVAKKTGCIISVTAKNGRAMAEAGDIVRAGQILISGVVGTADKVRFIHATGEVMAQVSYTKSAVSQSDERHTRLCALRGAFAKLPENCEITDVRLVNTNTGATCVITTLEQIGAARYISEGAQRDAEN